MKNYVKNLISVLSGHSILVTGSSGYIGQELVNQLKINSYDFIGVDRTTREETNIHSLDLADSVNLNKLLKEQKPSIIFHFGTHSALAYRDKLLESYNEDSIVTYNLLSYLKDKPETIFIYFSSSYVYSGIDSNKMVGESINLFPKHNFGLCKLFFENLLQREHSNSIIFRLSSVFGNGESLHPNAIEMMSREAINEKLITVWGKGKRKMQYVYIEDVIKYLVTSPKLAPGVYNLCGDDYQTIDETAKKIASYFNVDIKYLNKKEGETIPKLNNQKLVTSINGDLLSNIDSSLESFLSNIK